MKNLRFLTLAMIAFVVSFGSKAQVKIQFGKDMNVVTKIKPCMMEVRCTKLDSVQHDLELIPNLLEEIEFWKDLVGTKDKMILEKAHDIVALCDSVNAQKNQLVAANVKITLLTDKVDRRGRQRFLWSSGCLLAGRILSFFF